MASCAPRGQTSSFNLETETTFQELCHYGLVLSNGQTLTGSISIANGTMLWGGELTEFGRRACMIGLVVSVLVFAAPMLASAFGVNAAVV